MPVTWRSVVAIAAASPPAEDTFMILLPAANTTMPPAAIGPTGLTAAASNLGVPPPPSGTAQTPAPVAVLPAGGPEVIQYTLVSSTAIPAGPFCPSASTVGVPPASGAETIDPLLAGPSQAFEPALAQ